MEYINAKKKTKHKQTPKTKQTHPQARHAPWPAGGAGKGQTEGRAGGVGVRGAAVYSRECSSRDRRSENPAGDRGSGQGAGGTGSGQESGPDHGPQVARVSWPMARAGSRHTKLGEEAPSPPPSRCVVRGTGDSCAGRPLGAGCQALPPPPALRSRALSPAPLLGRCGGGEVGGRPRAERRGGGCL